MHFFLFQLGLLFWLLMVPMGVVHADINLPTGKGVVTRKVSPQAVGREVEVPRGGKVDIVLEAVGPIAAEAEFVIRTRPRHGKLEAMRRLNPRSVVVTYQSSSAAGVSVDGFMYAVRTGSAPLSPDATVRIGMVDPPASLVIPEELDFGFVFVGTDNAMPLRLVNMGKSRIRGTLEIPAGWIWEGPTTFDLAANARLEGRVVLRPEREGNFEGMIRVSGDQVGGVGLRATAVPMIVVDKRELRLSNNAARETALLVANVSDQERELTIDSGGKLEHPEKLLLPLEGEHAIPIRAAKLGSLGASFDLTLSSGLWKESIRVVAVPLPAALDVAPVPAEWREDRVHGVWQAAFEINNSGGVGVSVQLDPAERGFLIKPSVVRFEPEGDAGLIVEVPALAGTSPPKEIRLHLLGMDGMTFLDRTLPVAAPNSAEGIAEKPALEVDLSVPRISGASPSPDGVLESSGKEPRATPAPSSASTAEETPEPASPEPDSPEAAQAFAELSAAIFEESMEGVIAEPGLEIPGELEIRLRGSKADLSWTPATDLPSDYLVEVEYLTRNEAGRPVMRWWNITGLEIEQKEGKVRAILGGLYPGSSYHIRVRAVATSGGKGPASKPLRFQVPEKKPFRFPWWILVLILSGAGWFFYRRFRLPTK